MNPPNHFIKGMNEHPAFYQRNEWTSSILSKEWMNIQHFIKGMDEPPPTISSKEWMNIQHFIKGMDEHPAFYQRNGWISSILSKLWVAWQRPKVYTQFHCTKLQKTRPDRLRYISCQCKIHGTPKSKALVWY
jgi:hypothetical protein